MNIYQKFLLDNNYDDLPIGGKPPRYVYVSDAIKQFIDEINENNKQEETE